MGNVSDKDPEQPESVDEQSPDIGFRLASPDAGSAVTPPGDTARLDARNDSRTGSTADQAAAREIASALRVSGPPDWQEMEAVFAVTTTAVFAEVRYTEGTRSVRVQPAPEVLEQVRSQRALAAESAEGPWWRMLVRADAAGGLAIDYDFGAEPFPEGQLFEPEAYRLDLDEYPRESLPVWLAAYISHDDRQSRTPQQAARAARADRKAGVWPDVAAGEFPAFPQLWARWACLAAGFVAVRSEWGPRVAPAMGWFESSRRGGSTLFSLPGGRAVLSGGVWNAPALDATYNEDAPMPEFFAGAPGWVANPVLNPRAGTGLLSFVYWWEAGRWYRGESPDAEDCATAVPGVWTADTVAGLLAGLAANPPTAKTRAAASALVEAAELGLATRDTVTALFDEDIFDVDAAVYQLDTAGVLTALPVEMSEEEAVHRVRTYIESRGLDTTGYPLDELIGERINCGWMVYVPVPQGEMAIGRAIFYVADDGVLEHSSSSVAPAVFASGFEQRFHERRGTAV
ncbi:hypothetical protein [Nocardia sp. CA-290969]|uniref:hypothetical protein n=1 Tax=Nocardia sp. CA-290969 TaxID=3239986 RepID=UPI003D91647F